MSFLSEIKRRNVFRVAVLYGAVGWLLIQVAVSVEAPLGLPGWFDTLVIVLVLIGFPVALVLAWAFEMTADGIRLTEKAQSTSEPGKSFGRLQYYSVIGALGVAVLLLGFDRFGDREIAADPTLAVLMFTAGEAQAGFAVGLSEELANTLDEVPGLVVKGAPASLRGTELNNRELSEVLGADYLLSGNVVSSGSNLRVQAQLMRAVNDERLWSDNYDRTIAVDELFMMMDELVEKVADALQVSLGVGIGSRRGMTDDVRAYEAYVTAVSLSTLLPSTINDAMDKVDEALRYDDEFALAWALKAELHDFLYLLRSGDESLAQSEASLAAAQRAIEIEPDMGEAHAIIANDAMRRAQWVSAAAEYAAAWRLSPTPAIASRYAHFLIVLGRFDEASEVIRAALSIDALDRNTRSYRILSLGLQGRLAEANAAFDDDLAQFGDARPGYNSYWYTTLIRLGSADTTENTEPVQGLGSVDGIYPFAEEHIGSPDEAIAGIRRLYAEVDRPSGATTAVAILWLAYFGDTETAGALLDGMIRQSPGGMHNGWSPAMKAVRQTERFRQLLRDIGLVDYWSETGWPEICQPTAESFSCN